MASGLCVLNHNCSYLTIHIQILCKVQQGRQGLFLLIINLIILMYEECIKIIALSLFLCISQSQFS